MNNSTYHLIRLFLPISFSLLLLIALGILHFPLATVDDLFFTGTAANLAKGGLLENPHISEWMSTFGTTSFFVQPPLHPYLLSIWLKCFSISTASFLGYQTLCYIIIGLCLYLLARHRSIAPEIGYILFPFIALWLYPYGLRPDATGIALFLLSQIFLWKNSKTFIVIGSVLSAASVISHPFCANLVVAAWIIRCAYIIYHKNKDASAICPARYVFFSGIGISGIFILFLWLIDFRLLVFWDVFSAHSTICTPPFGEKVTYLCQTLTTGYQVLLLGPGWVFILVGVCASFFKTKALSSYLHWVWFFYAGMIILSLTNYSTYVVSYAFFIGVIIASVSLLNKYKKYNLSLITLTTLILCWSQIISIYSQSFALFTPKQTIPHLKFVASDTDPNNLLIDAIAARMIFDCNPPREVRDWLFQKPAGAPLSFELKNQPEGTVWILHDHLLAKRSADTGIQAVRRNLGTHSISSQPVFPYRLVHLER